MFELGSNILINYLFPLLDLLDLENILLVWPCLEDTINNYRPWGEIYDIRKLKKSSTRRMAFRDFSDNFQSFYIWGSISDHSLLSWIGNAATPQSSTVVERGIIKLGIRSRTGILRRQKGIDLLTPLRVDSSCPESFDQTNDSLYLTKSGNLYVRSWDGSFAKEQHKWELGSMRRSHAAIHVTRADGVTFHHVRHSNHGRNRVIFTFPFANYVQGMVQMKHHMLALVDDMGIIAFPNDYDGGDQYRVLVPYEDIPEKMTLIISMYSPSANSVNRNDPNHLEVSPEYNNVALMASESGKLYILTPSRYATEDGIISRHEWLNTHHPSGFPSVDDTGHDACPDLELKMPEISGQSQEIHSHGRVKLMVPYGYEYAISFLPDNSGVLYLDPRRPPRNYQFTTSYTFSGAGVCLVYEDGNVAHLQLHDMTLDLRRGPKNIRAVSSYPVRIGERLTENTVAFFLTEEGDLYQWGLVTTAPSVNNHARREVDPLEHLNSNEPLLLHKLCYDTERSRELAFTSPYVVHADKVNLPGKVFDFYLFDNRDLSFCVRLKEREVPSCNQQYL